MAVKFGSILEPNNPNTTAIAKTVHLSGARSVPTYEDLNNIIPTVLSPSFDPATGTIDTKDAIGQVWYVASENKYYKLSNIRITGDKPPFTPVTTWENFATSVVSSQEQWIHDYIASGVSTQTVLGYDPQGGSSTANNIYFTDTDRITFLTGGKYFKLDASNGSDDVNNPALIVTESTLTKQVSNIYTNDIDPLWDAATALNNNVEVLYNTLSTVNTDLQNTKSTVNNIITYINNDIAGYINDLYSKVGTVTANATWSGIIGDTTTESGNLPKGTVKAIIGDTNDYVVQFGTNQVDLQNVIRDDNNNELSRANILVGKNAVTKKQQAIVYTTSRDVSTNKIVSMDELTINPNSIYLGNQDTTTFTARDNLSITPGVISMYAGTNMNIQLGTKSENHNINIIPDSTNALYGATFTNLPLNVEALNFKNGTTLTPFDDAVNDIIDNKVYTVNININNKSRILTTIDPGELVVYHATSSNGVIIRTKPPSTGNIYQLQLLATNSRASYQYNFPLTSGTVALESYVDTAITNLATNFTDIVGDLQEQITDNYNELDDEIDAVNTRVDTTNTNLATTDTNLSNHEKKIATVSEYGHVMLGTKAVISNNFVCIGTHTNGGLVFAIDTELNATSGQPLKNSVITAELAKKATVDALTTGLATKVNKDMTSVTGREMIVSLANGTDTMSGLGIHDGNVIALGNGVGDAVVANGLGVDVATGISYLYSDNTEYNLTELVKTTIPGIQNTLSTKADSTTVTTELAKKADKATTLAGYGITDAYTKSAVDTALATKADKATTLAGYGITDAYTKTSTDTALAKKVDTTTLTTELAKKADKATTLSGYGITDAYTKTTTDTALATKVDKATTLEGYGITDAYTSDEVDTELAKKADTTTVNTELAKKADKATTLSGYGITDAYTKTATDTALAKKADKATTLAGYGITDAYTSDEVDTALAKKADSATVTTELAKKANKATTLEGYGITDAYTKTATDTALAKKADKATTLAGYGITDAYTKTAVDTELAKKADTTTLNTELAKKANKATTLEGYGITDAYTKTELDGKLVGAMRFKGNVDTYDDLPSTGQVHGDMWNVLDTGDNYAWNSDTSSWDNLSGVVNLADYAKTADVTSAISTAVSNHNSSATAHSTLFAAKADKATTLAGYGITDAYTKTAVDTELAKKATTEALNTGLATKVNTTTFNTELAKKADKTTTLAGYGITDAYTSDEVDTALAKKADSATVTTELAKKANKATTLEGYGITDAYTSEEVDTALAKKADTTTVNTELAKKADKATTLAGYGITDAYTKTATDTALAKKADKATTLAGYGITDAYTTTTVDTALAKKADSTTVTTELAKKADKATTLEGYGITDAYTSDEVDTALAKKADSATTLAGYGITDAYTKTATDTALAKKADSATVTTELAKKADKATTLAGYGITDAYTKTTVDTELAKKANKATTLSGYGITDAYTSNEVDTELAKKANVATTLEGYGITDAYTSNEVDTELAKKADKATTLAGYGITDAYTKSAVDTALAAKADSTTVTTELAKKADKATTLAGYGITDAYTKTTINTELAKKANVATTLEGYGITDAYTSDEVDTALAKKADSTTVTTELAKKADKATTLAGYGITDAYTKSTVDTALAKKANSATTLEGYGITNAYTSEEVDTALAAKADTTTVNAELAKKADKATTLAGYGITDAYTKTAVDTELAKKATTDALTTGLATKADKATTLAGYGITDTYTKTAVDTALAKKANSATTLAGYGITDAYTKTTTDTALAKKADKATTLAGYGITDTYTKTELDGKLVGAMRFKGNVDTYDDLPSTGQSHGDMWNVLDTGDNYAWNSDTDSWDNLSGVVNLADYAKTTDVTSAISTAVSNHNSSSSAHSTLFAAKADKATTLAGYGITDAYTKTTVDTELAKKATIEALTTGLATKADKATTLAGYGITDALSTTVTTQQTVASSVKVNNTLYATTIYENNTSLANKYAAKSHTHVISDITNLQTTLDGKASTTDIETLTDNLATEVSNREAADTNLQASITTNATNITTLQGKVSTLETNALSKTVTTQQSVASEVKFNGGIRADSIKTLYGTSLFTTVSAKGFDFTGIYRMFPYQSTTAFFESTVAGGSNTLLRATTIYENGVSLADTYAKKADVYTKTETDSAIVAVISNKNKSVWSPEFTTTDYDSTEEAYKWIIGVYTIPEYSNELPIVQIYEDSSATGTAKPTGATELELVQPKIAVTYDSTGTKAAVTAYFNFESADLPIVAYRYKAQIWFPGMSVTTETGGYPISNVKVKVLTQAEYDAITEKDEDTIYFISDAE